MRRKRASKTIKRSRAAALGLLSAVILAACGTSGQAESLSAAPSEETETTIAASDPAETKAGDSLQTDGKVLVAYFSYSENIGDTTGMELDAVASASLNRDTDNTEGNLQVMAQVIEEKTGGDVFHILMEEPYALDYSTMLPVAIDQMEKEDWPTLKEKIDNLADYDVIYLGTPVWNAALPPAMHTFFAENDLSGKIVIPFGIHLGSRFGNMIDEMEELAPGATIMEGFTVNAQTANDEVRAQFDAWLEE